MSSSAKKLRQILRPAFPNKFRSSPQLAYQSRLFPLLNIVYYLDESRNSLRGSKTGFGKEVL